jgi:hypothetical protein
VSPGDSAGTCCRKPIARVRKRKPSHSEIARAHSDEAREYVTAAVRQAHRAKKMAVIALYLLSRRREPPMDPPTLTNPRRK